MHRLLPALLAAACPHHAYAAMRVADKEALIQLFRLLGGRYWLDNTNWDPDGGSDPCVVELRWKGVGCIDPCDPYFDGPDCAFGRVTALMLRENNLTGSLTNWTRIGDLHNLSWIDFNSNFISGSVPAEIGNINNLDILDMSFNQLGGQLPTTLGNLNANGVGKLDSLELNNNRFEGTLPTEIGMFADLRMLRVEHNFLSGSIPTQVTGLTKLQVLCALLAQCPACI